MGFALSKLQLSSPAFEPRGEIPSKYTGEGEDISPPLQWTNVPDGTRSFALICHDPDAPVVSEGTYGFVHWVLYNISAITYQRRLTVCRKEPESIQGDLTAATKRATWAPCLRRGTEHTITFSGCSR